MSNTTFRVSQYAPANETSYDIWYEICNLDGAILVAVAYGVHATLFFSCATALWDQRKASPKQTWIYMAYICTHFTLSSIAFALNAKFNEMTFITNRDYPGGPNGFFIDNQSNWVQFVNYVFYIFIAWLQDALLIYRYWLFWDRNYWMLIVPGCLTTISIVMGSLLLAQFQTPGSSVWDNVSTNFFTTFWAVEISTTIFLTSLIVGRLLFMRYRIRKALGPRYQSHYLSIAAMLAESGIMFSIGGLIFVISYAYNSPFQNMVLNTVGQLESIAPVLIILRVARGRGLTGQKISEATGVTLRGTADSKGIALSPLQGRSINGQDSVSRKGALEGIGYSPYNTQDSAFSAPKATSSDNVSRHYDV